MGKEKVRDKSEWIHRGPPQIMESGANLHSKTIKGIREMQAEQLSKDHQFGLKERGHSGQNMDGARNFPTLMFDELMAVIIALPNNSDSMLAARKCVRSIQLTKSKIFPFIMPAVEPGVNMDKYLNSFGKTEKDWTWPYKPGDVRLDIKSGLRVSPYGAKDWRKVLACLLSHMQCWRWSIITNSPVMILEHDAIFTRKFDYTVFSNLLDIDSKFDGVIGLNNPLGATRRANTYYSEIEKGCYEKGKKLQTQQTEDGDLGTLLIPAPYVEDDRTIPQGIAGNSAYIIHPSAAATLFTLIDHHGMWPNDALMCNQLMPGRLMQAFPYYTTVQGVKSTTQG